LFLQIISLELTMLLSDLFRRSVPLGVFLAFEKSVQMFFDSSDELGVVLESTRAFLFNSVAARRVTRTQDSRWVLSDLQVAVAWEDQVPDQSSWHGFLAEEGYVRQWAKDWVDLSQFSLYQNFEKNKKVLLIVNREEKPPTDLWRKVLECYGMDEIEAHGDEFI
jgi:hypothetical protein